MYCSGNNKQVLTVLGEKQMKHSCLNAGETFVCTYLNCYTLS